MVLYDVQTDDISIFKNNQDGWGITYISKYFPPSMAQQPPVGQGLLIHEVSR